mgnify:CR=1 FL=1
MIWSVFNRDSFTELFITSNFDSEIIISLSDGSSIELIIDSIYMNVPDLDD